MLILSRKKGQSIIIGDGIEIRVVETRGGRVKLAFDAPATVSIRRSELPELSKTAVRQPERAFTEPAVC
ncbi:MAG: carbon storage regulator [Planctomycetales bacterium]|nr:carbon storage regulator [Planctomycetales bacterium]